jgi:hypothetical protein
MKKHITDFKTRIKSAGFQVSVITPKDVVKNEKLKTLFGINVTEGNAGNILFVEKKKKINKKCLIL